MNYKQEWLCELEVLVYTLLQRLQWSHILYRSVDLSNLTDPLFWALLPFESFLCFPSHIIPFVQVILNNQHVASTAPIDNSFFFQTSGKLEGSQPFHNTSAHPMINSPLMRHANRTISCLECPFGSLPTWLPIVCVFLHYSFMFISFCKLLWGSKLREQYGRQTGY